MLSPQVKIIGNREISVKEITKLENISASDFNLHTALCVCALLATKPLNAQSQQS